MAQLTSDIVWLVERDVTLPDGTIAKALVPQVYVRVKEGDLTGDGALISASAVNLKLSGDLTNSGTIAGRTVVALNAQNIHNLAGRIRGADVSVAARNDLNNTGGQIIATDSLVATAGRDLNVISTTRTQTGGTGNRTNIDRVAGLYVSNPGGTLVASAGRDVNLIAAELINNAPTAAGQAAGATLITAGRDLNLGTVLEASNNTIVWDANNFRKDSQTQEVGTVIQTTGNLLLSAGNDLSARAASVQAQGTLTLTAGNDIKLLAGQNTQTLEENHQYTSKGFLSKKTTTTTDTLESSTAQVTSLKGATVTVLAGNNAILEGTKITAQDDALVYAGNQLIAAAAHDSHSQSSSKETYKRGLSLSFGAIGAQIGTRGGGTATTTDTTTAKGVEVTSAQGNASLAAGGTALVEGAQISAAQGTASISGANVIIQAAVNTSSTSTTKTERGAKIDAIGFSNPSEGIGRKLQEMARLEQTSLARSTLTGQNVNITATQGDLRIAGTTVATPGTLTLNVLSASGTLHLEGQQLETVSSLQSFGKDLMYQKMRDQGSIEQTTEYNQFNAGIVQINAPKITAQIGSKDSAQQLASQPGMDWVGQLLNDPTLKDKVDWKTLQDASKSWDYKKQGLTPEGAAVVTIVVAFFTYGAASGAGGAVAGGAGMTTTTTVAGVTTTTLTTAGAIVAGATTAALTTLASQAAVSLINNQGDIGKVLEELGSSESLKALVTAMVTGGALAGLNLTPTGTPTPGGGAQTFMNQLGQNLKAGVARSLISTAINGGSLEDSLKGAITSAFIDTAAAQGAFAIGEAKLDAFTNKIAHALAGCAAGAARAGGGGGCAAGAIGAAVGEASAELYGSRADTVQFAAMMSAIAAAAAGGDASQINLASQSGANAAANNYVPHSPYKTVNDRVRAENARLTQQCASDCTAADFIAIDQQMQRLERAGTLLETSRRAPLNTEQAIQLAETVAALLPFYGTPIALYQAISGQSLTGTDLSDSERFFNVVAAAIPAGTVAYKLIGGAVADMRLAASFGGFSADGKALMDFSKLTSQQKGVVGELLGANTVQNALPGATRLGRLGEIGSQGIDDLYKVTSATADYVIVEYKFGTSALKTTADGVQMSDGWVLGSDRILNVAGNPAEALRIKDAVASGRVEKWVVHTDPAGGTSVWIVDTAGKVVKADSSVSSKLLGVPK